MNELILNDHLALKFMSRKDTEVNFLIFQFDQVSLFTLNTWKENSSTILHTANC